MIHCHVQYLINAKLLLTGSTKSICHDNHHGNVFTFEILPSAPPTDSSCGRINHLIYHCYHVTVPVTVPVTITVTLLLSAVRSSKSVQACHC